MNVKISMHVICIESCSSSGDANAVEYVISIEPSLDLGHLTLCSEDLGLYCARMH